MDWDYKQQGSVICPKKQCLVKLGTYSKTWCKVGGEAIYPLIKIALQRYREADEKVTIEFSNTEQTTINNSIH